MNKVFVFLLTVSLFSCQNNTKSKKTIEKSGIDLSHLDIQKVIFSGPVDRERCESGSGEVNLPSDSIPLLIQSLKDLKYAGLFKGACFNLVYFYSEKDTLILSYDDKIIGRGNSGEFYKLPEWLRSYLFDEMEIDKMKTSE